MKCDVHDERNTAGVCVCSCSDIVKALRLSDADIEKLKSLSKAINRTAYHGGLGLEESGKYLGLLDRIIAVHGAKEDGVTVDTARRNSCCGNSGTHGEGGREYCSTCGQEIA